MPDDLRTFKSAGEFVARGREVRVMFLESRFEHAIGRIFANGAVPLRLKLWNGRHIDLSSAPTVTVIIPKMSALRYFISPT